MTKRLKKLFIGMIAVAVCLGLMPSMAFSETLDEIVESSDGDEAVAIVEDEFPSVAEDALQGSEGNLVAEGDDPKDEQEFVEPNKTTQAVLINEDQPEDAVEAADVTEMDGRSASATLNATIDSGQFNVTIDAQGGLFPAAAAVRFAVWSDMNGQDDLRWYAAAEDANGIWSATVPVIYHRSAGTYQVHAYATVNGRDQLATATTFGISAPTASVAYSQTDDQKRRGVFSIVASRVKSPSGIYSIQAPTWSAANGMDDVEWYALERQADGTWALEVPCIAANRMPGRYETHLYVTGANGTHVLASAISGDVSGSSATLNATIDSGQFNVTIDAQGGLFPAAAAVRFAVWSDMNGQDDLRWYAAAEDANGIWSATVPVIYHRSAGTYQVHAYATVNGRDQLATATTFGISAPTANAEILAAAENRFQIKVSNVQSHSGVYAVQAPSWSSYNGQDDIKWHDAVRQADGSWVATVDAQSHFGDEGTYETHVYVTAANGVQSLVSVLQPSMYSRNCVFVTGSLGSGSRSVWVKNPSIPGSVQMPTWTLEGGQDDIKWHKASDLGYNLWRADINCHDLKHIGQVETHVYAGDTLIGVLNFEVNKQDISLSGDPELDSILRSIIERYGTDLHTLFNYVASYSYISGSKYPTGNWSVPFAKEMYWNGGGNCYRFAALFEWLAKAAGYDAQAVSGHVLTRSGAWNPHGWVEVYHNGTTYVCDPESAYAMPRYNFFWTTYAGSILTYRTW